MNSPDFIIIGAAKSGTTSVYNYLLQHPEIFMCPRKEPSFFAFEGQTVTLAGPLDQEFHDRRVVSDIGAYQALFQDAEKGMKTGEASVIYLYSTEAPTRIKKHVPEVKLIAILRDPVDRAFSGFRHMRRDGREPIPDFARALRQEEARIKAGWEHQWHYAQLGFYYRQLRRYYDTFSRDQISVYTYDELLARPFAVLEDIFRFLDVDPTFRPDISQWYNIAGKPRSRVLHDFLLRSNRAKSLARTVVPSQVTQKLWWRIKRWNIVAPAGADSSEASRPYLRQLYRDDIIQLQELLQRDLSHWLAG